MSAKIVLATSCPQCGGNSWQKYYEAYLCNTCKTVRVGPESTPSAVETLNRINDHERRLDYSSQVQEIHEFINEELHSQDSEWFDDPEHFLANSNWSQWLNLLYSQNHQNDFGWSRRAMVAASKTMENLR